LRGRRGLLRPGRRRRPRDRDPHRHPHRRHRLRAGGRWSRRRLRPAARARGIGAQGGSPAACRRGRQRHAPNRRIMTPARGRGLLLAITALLAALVFLAWSQPWFSLELTASSGDPVPREVRGDVAVSALAPLALAVLAIVAALALAGPVFRIVFGVLESLLGACVIAVTAVSLGDPAAASAHAVTDVTGVSGADSVRELISSVAVSVWPTVAI